MKKDLMVFSNIRQIKEYKNSLSDEGFFANTISLSEFFDNFAITKLRKASNVEQIIAMNKACNKTRNFNKLNFSNDFLTFLKNKEYMFSFFAELNSEKVAINELKIKDTNAFFDEYFDILDECLKHYKSELKALNLYDEITLENYEINMYLLNQYENITIFLNGFLKKYELEFIQNLSQFCNLKIVLNTSKYNLNLIAKSFKLNLEPNYTYTLSFKDIWQIVSKTKLYSNYTINTASFSRPLYQYLYALHLIAKEFKTGKIAVVLPDESVAASLKALDFGNFLNIASGKAHNEVAQKINSILSDEKYELSINNIQKRFLNTSKTKLSLANFDELKDMILALSLDDEVRDILNERLDDIKLLHKEFKLGISEIINLLDLDNIKVSHTNGGEVSVLGLLETRGAFYDCVIVLDFNDDLVPKRSVNEMFLNDSVRRSAGLISYKDRENLQRHYYKELFNSKKVYVLYLENEEKSPSRMLSDYKLIPEVIDEEGLLKSYLQAKNGENIASEELLKLNLDDIKSHDFFKPYVSYSKLSCYLNSSYEYYLKYIKGIKEPREIKGLNKADIGTKIHDFLEHNDFSDLASFKSDFTKHFSEVLSKIDFAIIYDNLDAIFYEISNNCKIAECEVEIFKVVEGFKLYGKIDRLGDNCLIDYKNTNKPSTNKHATQLAFYNLLLDDDLKSILLYLKSIKGVSLQYNDLSKQKAEIINALCEIKENGFVAENPENSWGYYHLIINKKDK